MLIHQRDAGNAVILEIEGPLLIGKTSDSFRERIQLLLQDGRGSFAINLAAVPKIDSAGIGSLMRSFTSIKKAGGKCRFFAVNPNVLQVLRMVRLDQVLDIAEDERAALAGL